MRRWLRLVLMCGLLLVVYYAVPAEPRIPPADAVARGVSTFLALAVLGALVTQQLRLQIDQGMDRRVDGLVVSVVGVVVAFALIFYLLDRSDPTQLVGLKTRTDSLYFTMTTLTTIGYGDIYAAGQAARTLVMIQMVFNVLFVTSAAALLSSRVRAVAQERAAARGVPLPDLENPKHKGL